MTSSRAQSSLEALISFAALLAALSALIFSAQRISSDFSNSVSLSYEQLKLSGEALSLDTAAACLPRATVLQRLSAVPSSDGARISSGQHSNLSEPVFKGVYHGGEGKTYVQGRSAEPV